ncbi:MAG: hypothetical protein WCL46_10810 [Chlorobium sp.]
MSIGHAKKVITEKLQSDADFRDRVSDFILYRGFFSAFDNLRDVKGDVKLQCLDGNQFSNKVDGFNSHLSKQDGHECPFTGAMHGYEHWVG